MTYSIIISRDDPDNWTPEKILRTCPCVLLKNVGAICDCHLIFLKNMPNYRKIFKYLKQYKQLSETSKISPIIPSADRLPSRNKASRESFCVVVYTGC